MLHQHFDSCPSTQKYLIDNISELLEIDSKVLISTEGQLAGIGRNENTWSDFKNSLAFSFTLTPQETATLTPLEIAVLIRNFMIKEYGVPLTLKWPNDLLTPEGKKCGGIICNLHSPNITIVGVGLNLGAQQTTESNPSLPFKPGFITNLNLQENDCKEIPEKIYQYMLNNRLLDFQTIDLWKSHCAHMNRSVALIESNQEHQGEFVGIGKNGEAQIKMDDQVIRSFFTGSLVSRWREIENFVTTTCPERALLGGISRKIKYL